MGDTAKKSEMEMETETEKVAKTEKGKSRISSAEFRERRDDLFREAAKLVSEVPSTKIAIFVTPPSSESDVSVHSFGHPSVGGVVKAFLEDNSPVPVPEDAEDDDEEDAEDDAEDDDEEDEEEEEEEEEEDQSSRRFWWEDSKQFDSMNPEQLQAAYDALKRVRNNMIRHLEAKERGQVSGEPKQ